MIPGSNRKIPEFCDENFKTSSLTGDKAYCVAVAHKDDIIAVRDSSNPNGQCLYFEREEWDAFIGGIANGEFSF